MRTALVVVTGVDEGAMDNVMLGLSWDLPQAVVVRHRIDPHSQVLTRVVSDAGGVLEVEHVPLEHACVSCALREDIVPTLERLARDGRWSTIVSGLPTATEATRLTAQLAQDARLARHLRACAVVDAVAADRATTDLLSDDLLRDRGLHTNPHDDRALGEVACAQVELADVVVLDGEQAPGAADLVRALARPGALVLDGADQLDGAALVQQRHQHRTAGAWTSPALDAEVPPLGRSAAWRLDLSSPRAFHPERLLDQVARLGGGPHRSRGCFWVPTRPGSVLEWSGAGGQLSIGSHSAWGQRGRRTRLVLTGLGPTPRDLPLAFDELLLSPAEAGSDPRGWEVVEDGLEPWLGEIRDVA